MSLIRIATALAATAVASPALAADLTEPAPIEPWEFYVGVHAGVVWGNGDWEDAVGNDVDLDGSRGIFGALAGINYRMDPIFLGLEGDVGFATDHFKWEGRDAGFDRNLDGCSNGTWCDINGHVRLRAGIAVVDSLDLFVAGGVALADGNGDDDDALLGESNDDTFVGWSLGVGADYAVTDHFKLRVEYLYDDYGDRNPVPQDSDYNSDWADNTVRGAAIFTF
jgi:outer membrane immunogenic protein